MKILIATSQAIPSGGGIASYNQEVADLYRHNHDIYLLTDSNETNVKGYKKTFSTIGYTINDYKYCKRLVEKINEGEYDLILNSDSSFIPVIVPFLKSKVISVSHFVNGMLAIKAGYNSKYLNGIIALSNYSKDFLIKKFKIEDTEKVKVIYNFVRNENINELEKINRKPIRIVYPGGTSIAKSIDVVQELVYRLEASNLDYEFIWIGNTILPSSKFSLFGLKETSQLFNNNSKLKITGLISREESIQLISSANIFILPSRLEGCPMTLLEAMRAGCIPIVSDAQHGSREIIEQTNAGLIVPQGSSKALYKAIENIIKHRDMYNELYYTTQKSIQTQLSESIWREKMNDILEYVLNKEKAVMPLTQKNLNKSLKGLEMYSKRERLKTILKSAYFRIKIDVSFIRSMLSLYKII